LVSSPTRSRQQAYCTHREPARHTYSRPTCNEAINIVLPIIEQIAIDAHVLPSKQLQRYQGPGRSPKKASEALDDICSPPSSPLALFACAHHSVRQHELVGFFESQTTSEPHLSMMEEACVWLRALKVSRKVSRKVSKVRGPEKDAWLYDGLPRC
jgi:hypothetical protein